MRPLRDISLGNFPGLLDKSPKSAPKSKIACLRRPPSLAAAGFLFGGRPMHSLRKVVDDNGVVSYEVIFIGTAFDAPPFRRIAVFTEADVACEWVAYLNGGSKPTGPFPQDPFPQPPG